MLKRFALYTLPLLALLLSVATPDCRAAGGVIESLYVIPFTQNEAPDTVAAPLFDALVELLYERGEQRGMQVTIVKQELTDADTDWFTGKDYLIGEVAGYSEDKGCCYTELKLTGRVQLHRPGGDKQPVIELTDEAFFNHDMTSLEQARTELAERIGRQLAERLLAQIIAD